MGEKDTWLDGFAWPVHRAHMEFVNSNCFDAGSVFHSHPRAHGETWEEPAYSVQVVQCSGSPGVKAAEANATLPLQCRVMSWPNRTERHYNATNGDLIALLRSGDMASFLTNAQEA